MKLGLLFIGDGRRDYLNQAVRSTLPNILHPITARLMINDEADPLYCADLDSAFPEYHIIHTARRGMAGAVQAGFDLALSCDVDAVLWIEEDFIVDRPLPIREAWNVLDSHSELAQMLFQRQPLGDAEIRGGSVAAGFPDLEDFGSWGRHSTIFSLNPSLIPASTLAEGWSPENEAGMTTKLLANGDKFGVWMDGPLVTHIGATRSRAWRL